MSLARMWRAGYNSHLMTAQPAFPLAHPLRVRWAEVDPQSVVFNGNYLAYADVAFTEYWREARYDIAHGTDVYVVKATLEYRAPARFDDLLLLRAGVTRVGNSSFDFTVRIERDGELLCEVMMVYVNADMTTRSSSPLPVDLRDAMAAYQNAPQETR